jgi:hypothetical protein
VRRFIVYNARACSHVLAAASESTQGCCSGGAERYRRRTCREARDDVGAKSAEAPPSGRCPHEVRVWRKALKLIEHSVLHADSLEHEAAVDLGAASVLKSTIRGCSMLGRRLWWFPDATKPRRQAHPAIEIAVATPQCGKRGRVSHPSKTSTSVLEPGDQLIALARDLVVRSLRRELRSISSGRWAVHSLTSQWLCTDCRNLHHLDADFDAQWITNFVVSELRE